MLSVRLRVCAVVRDIRVSSWSVIPKTLCTCNSVSRAPILQLLLMMMMKFISFLIQQRFNKFL